MFSGSAASFSEQLPQDRIQLFRRILKIAGRSESRVEELTQPIYSRWREETPPIETTILAAPARPGERFAEPGILRR